MNKVLSFNFLIYNGGIHPQLYLAKFARNNPHMFLLNLSAELIKIKKKKKKKKKKDNKTCFCPSSAIQMY